MQNHLHSYHVFIHKAVRYLERMLIQAQCQKDREKKCKITANDVEIRNEQNSAEATFKTAVNENAADDDVEMSEMAEKTDTKDEGKMDTDSKLANPISEESESGTNNSMSTSKNNTPEISAKSEEGAVSIESEQPESIDQNGAEQSSEPIQIEEGVQESDPYSSIINIDPRTYCKLGHFHLLLEDYPKGNL